IKDFNNKTKAQNTERTNIISEIDALNKRYQNALLKNADGEMADDDFQEVKKLTKGKIEVLERRLNDLAVVGTEIKDLVASTLKKVANIDRRYENGDIEEKRLIVSSMFPDFLEFDGTRHRTPRLNSAIALIYQNNSKLQGKKNGTSLSFLDLSQEVNPLVQNSNSFLEDLRRLNQLKDIPIQNNGDSQKSKKTRDKSQQKKR